VWRGALWALSCTTLPVPLEEGVSQSILRCDALRRLVGQHLAHEVQEEIVVLLLQTTDKTQTAEQQQGETGRDRAAVSAQVCDDNQHDVWHRMKRGTMAGWASGCFTSVWIAAV
jgi:hypothetical protein